MARVRIARPWESARLRATDEGVYLRRRELLAAAGAAGLLPSCYLSTTSEPWTGSQYIAAANRNPKYVVPERPVTPEVVATRFNNFYEFSSGKGRVWELARDFVVRPWSVEVSGLVRNPRTYDVDALLTSFALEERLYRLRCVEAWAMTIPWTGFPLAELLRAADPLPDARFVRLVSAVDPEQMPGVKSTPSYPWPYVEGLSLAEAMNELSFIATGVYGKALPAQNGAPLRLVVPWKYGYKSCKSIVRIELVSDVPATFWPALVPSEYDFVSNVDPGAPHPRWSQASELLVESGDTVPTQRYNGYADLVAHLY